MFLQVSATWLLYGRRYGGATRCEGAGRGRQTCRILSIADGRASGCDGPGCGELWWVLREWLEGGVPRVPV